MSTFKKIYHILTPHERRLACLLIAMIMVMAFLDTLGVASIMPFMAVLGNPEMVETNRWLSIAYTGLDFETLENFLVFLGMVVFAALVVAVAFKTLTLWAMLRFVNYRNFSLSCRLLQGYLDRPYSWFLNRHSADLGRRVLSEAERVVQGVIMPGMHLLAQGTVATLLTVLLVLINPLLALMVAGVLGGVYAFIYLAVRRYLSRIGSDRVAANRERFQIAQEALGGIKEVKIFGREGDFFGRFIDPALRYARHQANNQIVAEIPRYIMEIVAFGGILLITLYLFKNHGNFGKILPLLAVYAFAGYRLLPALQNMYHQVANLRFGVASLDLLYKDIVEFNGDGATAGKKIPEPLAPKERVHLEDICFTYPGAGTPVLKDLTLDIPVNSAIGLVGATGSGKTTLVDIIMGLLWPQRGQLVVDNSSVNLGNVRAWQRSLGYVTQHIYLSDDTVAANIGFGIPPERIDRAAVERAAKIAELHDFVTRELPNGYDTLVGERGVRLSGGERQRIGIARALYCDPPVLIMDEATSSLDNITENHVMQAIRNMRGKRTVIIIAHRLTTVRECDSIVFLDHGVIKAQGTYEELVANNELFRLMSRGVGPER